MQVCFLSFYQEFPHIFVPSQPVHLRGNQEGIGQLGTVVGVVYFLLMN